MAENGGGKQRKSPSIESLCNLIKPSPLQASRYHPYTANAPATSGTVRPPLGSWSPQLQSEPHHSSAIPPYYGTSSIAPPPPTSVGLFTNPAYLAAAANFQQSMAAAAAIRAATAASLTTVGMPPTSLPQTSTANNNGLVMPFPMMAAAAAAHARAKLLSATQNLHTGGEPSATLPSPTSSICNSNSGILVSALQEQHKSFLEMRGEVAPQTDFNSQVSPRSDVSSCCSSSTTVATSAASPKINYFHLDNILSSCNNNNNVMDAKNFYSKPPILKDCNDNLDLLNESKSHFANGVGAVAKGTLRYSPNLQRSI